MPKKSIYITFLYILFLFLCLTATEAIAQVDFPTGNFNLFLGKKVLDKDDWEPIEKQKEFELEIDLKEQQWPISFALALSYSGDDFEEGEGKTSELHIGIKKILDYPPINIHPFLGGGLALITAEGELSIMGYTFSRSDSGLGIWITGGVYWTLNNILNIGFELKYSYAKVSIDDYDIEVGGLHYGALVGFHW